MPCLTPNPDRLYDLVPVVYRLRDADQGYPLKALLRVIAEQVDVVEQDIATLYENWFVETCSEWVVPYIGSLIDYEPVHEAGEPTPVAGMMTRAAGRNRILFPRREVANTVRLRRRKGTLAALQEVATATSGWPTRIVEIVRQLAVAQNVSYLHQTRGRTIDLRRSATLDELQTAFNRGARTIDVRRGGWSAADVRAYVWRLRSYGITKTPAFCYEEAGPNCFLFNPLGIDTPLFTRPRERRGPGVPELLDVPAPIMRSNLERFLPSETSDADEPGVPFYYGDEKSFQIWVGSPPKPVPADQIVAADLDGWTYRPGPGQVAVDPERGRIAFPPITSRKQPQAQGVWVSYHYGFSADMGGGEYQRDLTDPAGTVVYFVGEGETFTRIADALTQWQTDRPASAAIELTDSSVHVEPINISLAAHQRLALRGRNGRRPVLRLLDFQAALPDNLSVWGEESSWFTLDGVVVIGRAVQFDGEMAGAVIRHSTLVPGWALHGNCEPKRPTEPSIVINGNVGCVTIEHSITGAIEVNRDQVQTDPVLLRIRDSIVDATGTKREAVSGPGCLCAHATLAIARSTIFGKVSAHAIELIEDSILMGTLFVCRRQHGCIRFSYVEPGSRTPRRFQCQPDLVEAAVLARFERGEITAAERDVLRERERVRVEPEFNSSRYGDPTYGQLTSMCAREITHGAEDQSEMGAFHDLYQPQRAANLRARLAEFAPAGVETTVVYAT